MRRRGFTLVELLVVITIISMMAGVAMTALYKARDIARTDATKATIAKLDKAILAKFEEIRTARPRVRFSGIDSLALPEMKLRLFRERWRLDMPDRFTDITYPRTHTPATLADATTPLVISVEYIAKDRFTRKTATCTLVRNIEEKRMFNRVINGNPTPQFGPAECLYLWITNDHDLPPGITKSEIGDVDGDGFREFIDGWGRPIMFLRWAPGFRSEIQNGDALNYHDPNDPYKISDLDSSGRRRVNETAFQLFPLIYSGGPDKMYGLEIDETWVAQSNPGDSIDRLYTDGSIIGSVFPQGHPEFNAQLDNITNHDLRVGMQ